VAMSLQIDWKAEAEQQEFRLEFHFGSNTTHWFLYQIDLRSRDTTAVALRNALASGAGEVLHYGHIISALKGYPFECHYLELPLHLISPGTGGTAGAVRCVPCHQCTVLLTTPDALPCVPCLAGTGIPCNS
jgi:hypothetical protein